MKRLKVAIVGLGRGATLTVPAFLAHPRVTIIGGCDPAEAARAGFSAQTGAPGFADIEELLGDPAVDALYIASPHGYHAAHAIAAARAGKHVLVEKPMAVTVAEGTAMVAAARAAGTVLMVGPSHGHDPPVALAADLIAGPAGPARMIHAMNYTDFLYRPRRAEELERAAGGGVVLSQATHQVDMVRRLAASPVARVRGWVGDWDVGRRTDGAFTALIEFESGAAASLTYSGYARYDSDALAGWVGELGFAKQPGAHLCTRQAFDDAGEQAAKVARGFAGAAGGARPAHHERFGSVIASCVNADLVLVPDGVEMHGDDGVTLHRAAPEPAPRYGVVDAFVGTVLDGAPTLFDGRWGLETLACCAAIIRSAETRADLAPADLMETPT